MLIPIEPHHRDAEFLCFVGQVPTDAIAREHDDANRHRLKHLVVALEGGSGRSTSLHSDPPVNSTRVPAGIRTWASARRFALLKSRLSIIAAVRARWLTIDPERGRHADPVRLS